MDTASNIASAEDAGVPVLPVKSEAPPEETAEPMAEEQGPPPLPVPDAAADQAGDSQLRTMVEEQGFVAAPMPEVHPTEGELQQEVPTEAQADGISIFLFRGSE